MRSGVRREMDLRFWSRIAESVIVAAFLRGRAGKETELASRLHALVLASRLDPGGGTRLGGTTLQFRARTKEALFRTDFWRVEGIVLDEDTSISEPGAGLVKLYTRPEQVLARATTHPKSPMERASLSGPGRCLPSANSGRYNTDGDAGTVLNGR
jgi:hypothetical protein